MGIAYQSQNKRNDGEWHVFKEFGELHADRSWAVEETCGNETRKMRAFVVALVRAVLLSYQIRENESAGERMA